MFKKDPADKCFKLVKRAGCAPYSMLLLCDAISHISCTLVLNPFRRDPTHAIA